MRRLAAACRCVIPANREISASISESVRGFMARKFPGCSRSLATVSCLYGTEPITSVGFSRRMFSTDSMCQQSPSFGSLPTGATSAHHFVTPTRRFCAPIAHKMDVALGASETMRCVAVFFLCRGIPFECKATHITAQPARYPPSLAEYGVSWHGSEFCEVAGARDVACGMGTKQGSF